MTHPDDAYDDSADTKECPQCDGRPWDYTTDECTEEDHEHLQGQEHACRCTLCEDTGEVHPSVWKEYLRE